MKLTALAFAALVMVACGKQPCAGSISSDPQPRIAGSYALSCGVNAEIGDDSPMWAGTEAWDHEVCGIVARVSEIAGSEIDCSGITLRMERAVTWNGRSVFGVTVPQHPGYLVRVQADDAAQCAANTALGHELLHVALDGDGAHESPLWANILDASTSCRDCAHTAAAIPAM